MTYATYLESLRLIPGLVPDTVRRAELLSPAASAAL